MAISVDGTEPWLPKVNDRRDQCAHRGRSARLFQVGAAIAFSGVSASADTITYFGDVEVLDESDYLSTANTDFPLDAFVSGRGIALNRQDAIALSFDARTLIFDGMR